MAFRRNTVVTSANDDAVAVSRTTLHDQVFDLLLIVGGALLLIATVIPAVRSQRRITSVR